LFRIATLAEFNVAYKEAVDGPLSGDQNATFRKYLECKNDKGTSGLIDAYKKTTAPWRVKEMLSNPGDLQDTYVGLVELYFTFGCIIQDFIC
jgi:hypothetical protein